MEINYRIKPRSLEASQGRIALNIFSKIRLITDPKLALTNNFNKSRLIFGIIKIDVIICIHDLGKNCNLYYYLRILAID